MNTDKAPYLDIKNSLMFVDVFANHPEVLRELLQRLLKITIDGDLKVNGEHSLINGTDVLNPRLDISCESNNELPIRINLQSLTHKIIGCYLIIPHGKNAL